MASRDIANMHLFLDLKKKFPDLPDETLRSYISLFAEDKEKCISLLQKECENHYHPSQPFLDFRLPDNKVNSMKNDYIKHIVENPNESLSPPINLQHTDMPIIDKKFPTASGRSSSHAGVVHLPGKLLSLNTSCKTESLSAPVITNSERPFKDMYKESPVSSQIASQIANKNNNQIMFHTTKNHIIEAPRSHESTAFLSVCGEPELSRRHAVKLSITPSFPFHQQHVNVFNNSVCTTALHPSRPDRHTTSLNFQLQPQISNQFPVEISTIPTNIGNPCNSRDFCSHVQISVCDQGTTFTAVRLQHPNYSQNENKFHLPITEECPNECTMSSQAQNSSLSSFPNQRIQLLPGSGEGQSFKYSQAQSFDQSQNMYFSKTQPYAQISSVQNYQSSHDYILAVKNQQIAQLDFILNELEKEKSVCCQLKDEVNMMEQEVIKRNTPGSIAYVENLQKLREEIRNLSIEISCLSMEVDAAGQIPLGVTDEDIYGPNSALNQDCPQVKSENMHDTAKNKSSFEEENDERNQWLCKNCTFANHPALEKCEICELPKNIGAFFDDK